MRYILSCLLALVTACAAGDDVPSPDAGAEDVPVQVPPELQIQPHTQCLWGATTDCLAFGGATGSDNSYCRSVCPSSNCLETNVRVYYCSTDSFCSFPQWQSTPCAAGSTLCAIGSQVQGRCTYLTAPK